MAYRFKVTLDGVSRDITVNDYATAADLEREFKRQGVFYVETFESDADSGSGGSFYNMNTRLGGLNRQIQTDDFATSHSLGSFFDRAGVSHIDTLEPGKKKKGPFEP